MFAAGLIRSFVMQVMLMDLDAMTAVWGDDNVSVDTGTVEIKNCFTSFATFTTLYKLNENIHVLLLKLER